jgi:subtilase family serine protease
MTRSRRCACLSGITVFFSLLFLAATSWGQALPRDRVRTAIRDSEVQRLEGNVHPLARAEFDRGRVDDSAALPRMTIFFALSPDQSVALDRLLSEQQDRSSPNYHRWITPQEFGDRFGLSQNDLNKVVAWLESRGFAVQDVPASRNAVSFSGSAAQVTAAFQTAIHHYVLNGEEHYANSTEPTIPSALAGIVSGVKGLNDFRPQPETVRRVLARPTPDFSNGTTSHFLAPADFSVIYNVQPLYSRGIDGTGQKIAVVGQSDIQLSDIRQFRSLMGLPTKDPQVVLVPGSGDPGMQDRYFQEADLDLEWAGAVARNATLIYVNSTNAWESLHYAVTSNLAPVISVSYTNCEPLFSASDVQWFLQLGQQASVQGQTIVAASGDSGAAGCDNLFAPIATQGLAVNMPASLPHVTAVGGTEFNEGSGTYWTTTNAGGNASTLSYIPEITWNDSSAGSGIQATGGGASTLFTKPFWQSGPGVPDDGARDVPDISFSASANHDGYLICDETFDANTHTFTPVCPNGYLGGFSAVGGTSASTPAFAGIVALLNQSMNSSQGNINQTLYSLAKTSPNPLHSIASGGNVVPCQVNPPSPGCPTSGSGAGFMGYSAGAGYDLATGLGSVDAYALINGWPSIATSPDFEITATPASFTLSRGSVATAQIMVNTVGGLTGVPSLACNVPAIFVNVACSIAPTAGTNRFTLTLTTSTSASAIYPAVAAQPATWAAQRLGTGVGTPGAHLAAKRPFPGDAGAGAGRFPFAAWLIIGGIAICWWGCQRLGRKTQFAPLFAIASAVAMLLGCAGATSSGPGASAQVASAPPSIQLTPRNVFLGPNGQQQFSATVINSSNTAVNWSMTPPLGTISAGVYTAPSTFSANQSVTVTATSVADPSKQASATILLLPQEAGVIQVTGSLNGISHAVGISLTVN